ncbi:nucleotidyltransferase domain-containing protein [Flavisolibacter ginsenosidimutans]|uniref:Nucleotidyltransferase family protein n=1 Tax=Flavisolibacter ginsenosidimutans TaxID=661481 RepID=A0A5B8UNJ7_9BACT|nr:nucleotidyltransferase [Flavisolibacter ginsenosidimutans]QEC58168.1 nucleotidyltransferase family protein [Flavisolibacter ginsenosidimutans]
MLKVVEPRIEAQEFYKSSLELLTQHKIPFMLGGGFALYHYTGIIRDMKDMDVFCKPVDYPKILKLFAGYGYETQVYDVRWLAKIHRDGHYIDVIFNTVNNICTVDDAWFEHASCTDVYGVPVKIIPAEELVWCKLYVQNRERYDGSDINHILLKKGGQLNWKRLLNRIDPHWHLLLMQILQFQFVYPSEYRNIIPDWLFHELIQRAQDQYELPPPFEKVCRGPVIDNTQYEVDIKDWNYKSYTIMTI